MGSLAQTLDTLASNRSLTSSLYTFNILLPIFLAGISCALSAWVIPIILSSHSPYDMTQQFKLTIQKGGKYLQSVSRALALSYALLAFLLFWSADDSWRGWVLALASLAAISPYEIFVVFPVNNRILDLAKKNNGGKKDDRAWKKAGHHALRELLESWQHRNTGRILLLLIAVSIVVEKRP